MKDKIVYKGDNVVGALISVPIFVGTFSVVTDFAVLENMKDYRDEGMGDVSFGEPFLREVRNKARWFEVMITLYKGDDDVTYQMVRSHPRFKNHTNEQCNKITPYTEELRRDQVDDLMPTIEEGEVVEECRSWNDVRMVSKIFGYPSECDHNKKIRIDCAHNLKFSCMIGFEFLHANVFPILYVNVMSKKFYNFIRKDKLEYNGNNVVGALMNIPIFVGTFSILTDFSVLEDMYAYRDEGMGDVIFGEPFLREVGINAKQFEGMITIYNGNEMVTYQMVRSHPSSGQKLNTAYPLPSDTTYPTFCPIQRIHPIRLIRQVFYNLDLLEYSSFISSACRRTHCKHTAKDDLEVFSIDDLGLDWISAHKFLTRLQRLSSYASGHLEVFELATCLEKASFSCTSGHVEVF
ncbi:hypothetical protein Tco_0193951 [Tanacetum coccineum]